MKRITKIRIPKGKKCEICKCNCKFFSWNWVEDRCSLFDCKLDNHNTRCPECLKMFPNGTVFVEQVEKK